ncbi:putative non-specific serine/threonine protein kinase [Helianthus anomalus]
MELTWHMKMARFQTFWIQTWKNKPLDESRKTGQTKLTDFGLSKVGLINSTEDLSSSTTVRTAIFQDNEVKTESTSTMNKDERQKLSVVGTPDYLAPEILLGMGHGSRFNSVLFHK